MRGRVASQAPAMRKAVKQRSSEGAEGSECAPLGQPRLHAIVLIPKDLPLTQIEIEVIAALLDDWDGIEPSAQEDHSK